MSIKARDPNENLQRAVYNAQVKGKRALSELNYSYVFPCTLGDTPFMESRGPGTTDLFLSGVVELNPALYSKSQPRLFELF